MRNWKAEILTQDDLETEEVELRQREGTWEGDWETGRLKSEICRLRLRKLTGDIEKLEG